jgi:transporter family-2 protein
MTGDVSALAGFRPSPEWYIYLGGVLGIGVVLVNNVIVLKISAFYLTLLIFVGQVFSGVVIDFLLAHAFSARILLGGLLVTIGLCVNLLLDRREAAANEKEVKN